MSSAPSDTTCGTPSRPAISNRSGSYRSPEDPTVFFLYEQYVDAADYEAHMASPYFEQYVKSEAIPNLESRERAFYETMDLS